MLNLQKLQVYFKFMYGCDGYLFCLFVFVYLFFLKPAFLLVDLKVVFNFD